MKVNRIRICGRKTTTLPKPAMTPSISKLRKGPSGICVASNSPSLAMPASIMSIGKLAQLNTAWNTRNKITAKDSIPKMGCSNNRSAAATAALRTGS